MRKDEVFEERTRQAMANAVALRFDEPMVLLGATRERDGFQPVWLPLATVLSHALVIARSGGGKSHILEILGIGLARALAVRRLNLTAYLIESGGFALDDAAAASLVGLAPGSPPLTLCMFDPHRDLVKRVFEDLTRQIAVVRCNRQRYEYRTAQDSARMTNRAKPASPATQTFNIKRKLSKPTVLAGFQQQVRSGPAAASEAQERSLPNWEDVLEGMITCIDLGDRENVFGLNLLDTAIWESKENCASTLIEIFQRIFPLAWGSRMEDCFRHSVYALYLLNTQRLREEQFTILDVISFITYDHWRESLLEHPVISKENPVIGAWWKVQFADKMSDNFRNEVVKPVLNKLNPFAGSDILSRIFGQSRTTLDFEPLIRQGNIALFDLAASEIETENCALAGAILIGFLLKKVRLIAGTVRNDRDRPGVQLMVDEFNVLLAAPYAEIMGQYRKWGVGATLATQSLTLLDKLDPTLRPLVMANAANLFVLQLNAEDAEYLRRELVADGTTGSRGGGLSGAAPGGFSSLSAGGGQPGPDLYDLVNAERGKCYLKGTFDGFREQVFTVQVASRPFPKELSSAGSGSGEDEIESARRQIGDRLIERSRALHTRPGQEVGEILNRKQLDYLQIYRLEPLKPGKSDLIDGFISWGIELAAVLALRLRKAQAELEDERLHRARNRRRNAAQPRNSPQTGEPGGNEAVEEEEEEKDEEEDTGKGVEAAAVTGVPSGATAGGGSGVEKKTHPGREAQKQNKEREKVRPGGKIETVKAKGVQQEGKKKGRGGEIGEEKGKKDALSAGGLEERVQLKTDGAGSVTGKGSGYGQDASKRTVRREQPDWDSGKAVNKDISKEAVNKDISKEAVNKDISDISREEDFKSGGNNPKILHPVLSQPLPKAGNTPAASSAETGAVLPARGGNILPFAPGNTITLPHRQPYSAEQAFQDGRKPPENKDLTPGALVNEQRRRFKNGERSRRNLLGEIGALQGKAKPSQTLPQLQPQYRSEAQPQAQSLSSATGAPTGTGPSENLPDNGTAPASLSD